MNENVLKLAEALCDRFSLGESWETFNGEGAAFSNSEPKEVAEFIETWLTENSIEISDPYAAEKAEKANLDALKREFAAPAHAESPITTAGGQE